MELLFVVPDKALLLPCAVKLNAGLAWNVTILHAHLWVGRRYVRSPTRP
jgi:hypothetical protein